MKRGINILFCFVFFTGCRGQKQKVEDAFQVNRFAKDSFYFAKTLVDTADGGKALFIDGVTAIIVPERMGSQEEIFLNGEKFGVVMPCQCGFKNDTIKVVSALAWEGGFAYISQASKGKSENYLMLFGKNRKWKIDDREYKEEVKILSQTHKLVISKQLPLKEGEQLYGWFDIKTPIFFETTNMEDEKENQQHIMRIYFSCQVWYEIF